MAGAFASATQTAGIALILSLLLPLAGAVAQPAVFYVYDDLNRLIAVIDPDGNAASFTYDTVGNILRIDRQDAPAGPEPVAITFVNPSHGKVGTAVQVFGRGFASTPSQGSVAFGGTTTGMTAAAPTRIVTAVPPGASTGRITVSGPAGTAVSPSIFVVPGAITLDPPSATVFTRRSLQFRANESGNPFPSVFWSVADVLGGNSTVGTISVDGLYTAPEVVPTPSTVTITAVNTEDPQYSAVAMVTIATAPDMFLLAQPVTLQVAPGLGADRNVGTALSVTMAPTLAANRNVTSSVSVHLGSASVTAAVADVTVSVGPVVSSVSPPTGARGSAGLAVRLDGAELADVVTVRFLVNNVVDSAITVTGLVVDPDGRGANVTVSIAPGAAPGPRVVQTVAPTAASTPVATPGNRFVVQ